MARIVLVIGAALASVAGDTGPERSRSRPTASQPSPDQAALEKAFQDALSGAVMTGFFTVEGQPQDRPHQPERYTLGEVKKLGGDVWLIPARIQYGERDVTVPVPVKVRWAGDTPVISLTDIAIPGLGDAFSARVLIYRGQYAGTWQHGEHGGHMFGTIVRTNDVPESPPSATPPSQNP